MALIVLTAVSQVTFSQVGLSVNGGFAKAQGYSSNFSKGIGVNLEQRLGEKVRFVVIPTLNSRGYNGNLGVSTVKVNYVDIPVQLQFDLAESSRPVYLGLGGYYGFALSGKYKSNLTASGDLEWHEMTFGEDAASNRSKTDYGLIIDIGGRFPTYSHYVKVGIQTMFGLKNVAPKELQEGPSEAHIRLMNYSFYVTYCFGDDD